MAAPSSTRRPSIGSPLAACGSPNHVAGSLPCMPARHDILVGALDFLWRPWGSIEVWEDAVTFPLHAAGVTTMLVSDHPHLFETGGENYHTDFVAWDYVRGHEDDPWRTRPDPSWVGAPALDARPAPWRRGYDISRTHFRDEADFPGPRTMQAAARWLRATTSPHRDRDRSLLPVGRRVRPPRAVRHARAVGEPLRRPSDPWTVRASSGRRTRARAEEAGLSEREARHLRANYGAKLSMIDALARPAHRRRRRTVPVGRHRDHRVHRPRPLPRRARHLGEACRPALRRDGPHPTARLVARTRTESPGHDGRRLDDVRRPPRHAGRCLRRDERVEHRTHGRSLVPVSTARRHPFASGHWPASGDAKCTSWAATADAVLPGAGRRRTRRFRCGRTAGRPCRCTRSHDCACPGRTSGPALGRCPARTCP